MINQLRLGTGLLLALCFSAVRAELDPAGRAERWWDASRAERIGYSDRAAADCRSKGCDSLQIRSCLNETLKPPVSRELRGRTVAQVTASCIAGFATKR